MCLPEKARKVTAFAAESPFSPVRFVGNNREIRAFFAYFGDRSAGFLCIADCVAEGSGFEPSVPFCYAKPRRVRKLQMQTTAREFMRKADEELCSPVSIRRSFVTERRTPGDFVAGSVRLARPHADSVRV
jgi:hypothetical protein